MWGRAACSFSAAEAADQPGAVAAPAEPELWRKGAGGRGEGGCAPLLLLLHWGSLAEAGRRLVYRVRLNLLVNVFT